MNKTTLTDNSSFNKVHDTYIQTYKQATTAAAITNKSRLKTLPRAEKKRTNKQTKDKNSSNNNYKRLVIMQTK